MSERILVNRPHALYYNGELVGIITNPDPLPDFAGVVEDLELGDAVTITTVNQPAWDRLREAAAELDIKPTIELEEDEMDGMAAEDYE
jgi:hypothetical protein